MRSDEKPSGSEVQSLEERRRNTNLRIQRQSLTSEERLNELELQQEKLQEVVLQQQRTIEELEDRQWRLLRLIGKRLGIGAKRTAKS